MVFQPAAAMVLERATSGAVVLRSDFDVLSRRIHGKPLIYLDSAATSLKPRAVIAAMNAYYAQYPGNVFRGNHLLAEEASDAFDAARTAVAEHIGGDPLEVTFWANTTDAINAVARGLRLTTEDRVVVPVSEHHSNFLPWLRGASVDLVPVDREGFVDPAEIRSRLERGPRPRLVALGHVSNVTGAIQDVAQIGRLCNEFGVPLLVDGAQAAPHLPVDVEELGCSFYAFSAHKMLGPTGVGALWGRLDEMERLEPVRLGGGTVLRVQKDRFELKDPPHNFEAGTPNIAGVIGFGAAIRYLQAVPERAAAETERRLAGRMLERAAGHSQLRVLGPQTTDRRIALVTLLVDGPQSADLLSFKLSDRHAVMTRSGTHCAQPFFSSIGAPTSVRLSAYLYTTVGEIDTAFDAIESILAD